MIFYRLINKFIGQGVFRVAAARFGDMATLFSERGIEMHGVSPGEDGRIYFSVSVFSFEKMLSVCEGAGIEVFEVSRTGASFFLAKQRKRYGIFIGLLLFCAILFVSRLYVWRIDITGNKATPEMEILNALAEAGIRVGAYIPDIDPAEKKHELLLSLRSLSSAAISINGTNITVSVLERKYPPETIDTGGYYNVIASCDGIIMDIDAAEGTPEVSAGETVFKGELLINTFVVGSRGLYRPTHARGEVYAAVNESYRIEIPFTRTVRYYTGRTHTGKRRLLFGREVFSFSSFESPYEYFDSVTREKDITLFGALSLPLKECTVMYYEYIPKETVITKEQAELLAREALDDKLAEADEELLSLEAFVSYDEKNGVCVLEADAVFKRNIAVEQPVSEDDQSIAERLPTARE